MGFVRCMGMSEDDIDDYLQPTVNLGTLPNQTKSYSYPSVSGKKGLKGITFNTQAVAPATLQSKSVTLSSVSQTITPDSGYNGMSSVTTSVPLQGKGNTTVPIDVSAKMYISPDNGYLGLSGVWVTPNGSPGSLYHNETRCSQTSGVAGTKYSDELTSPGNGNGYFHTYNFNGDANQKGTGILQVKRAGQSDWVDLASYKTNKTDWVNVGKGDTFRTKVVMTAEAGLTGAFCAEVVIAAYNV